MYLYGTRPVYKPTIRRKSVDTGHLLSSFIISRQKTFSSSSSHFIYTLVDTWVTPVMSNKELCWLKKCGICNINTQRNTKKKQCQWIHCIHILVTLSRLVFLLFGYRPTATVTLSRLVFLLFGYRLTATRQKTKMEWQTNMQNRRLG